LPPPWQVLCGGPVQEKNDAKDKRLLDECSSK
jgi:hypothetical protein